MDAPAFEQHARVEATHWWFTARRQILLRMIDRIAGGVRVSIADIGCGTGGNAAAFAAAGHAVLGIDPSPDAIALARHRFPTVEFVQSGDPESARGHLAGGGIAVLGDVLEHVADDGELLARAVDVMPVGGHVVITVPADPDLWSPHDVAFGHHRRYRTADLAALWRHLPVDARLLTPFNARLRPAVAAVRRLARRRRPVAGGDLTIPAGFMNAVLRQIFAGEANRLVAAITTGAPPYRNGVSLLAVLRRR